MLVSEFSFCVISALIISKLNLIINTIGNQICQLLSCIISPILDPSSTPLLCLLGDMKTWLESNLKSRLCEIIIFTTILLLVAIYLDDWLGISSCFQNQQKNKKCFQFGYKRRNGPAVWKEHFQWAQGYMQSPINIIIGETVPMHKGPLLWKYHREVPDSMVLYNDGYSITITGNWKCGNPQITGEPLNNIKYDFNRIYFHWGPTDTEGSEHTIDYERFPLEVHIIYLKEGYKTPMQAHYDQCPQGIIIIAYLFEITPVDNPGFLNTIIENLPNVKSPKTKCQIEPFALSDIYPEFHYCYYMYDGSVTQPPCSEIVSYIVQPETIAVSKRQMSLLRKLIALDGKPMTNNSRPVQKLNSRNVYYFSG